MTYTHGHHESVLRSHTWRTAENSAGYLLPHLRPGQSLLDVGCGPGTITADLALLVAPGQVVGLDAASEAQCQLFSFRGKRHGTAADPSVGTEAGEVFRGKNVIAILHRRDDESVSCPIAGHMQRNERKLE